MEENFEKFLSLLAHGKQPFIVFNEEDNNGNLQINIVLEALDEQHNSYGTITHNFFSHTDEDTGITTIKYNGETINNNILLADFIKNLESEYTNNV